MYLGRASFYRPKTTIAYSSIFALLPGDRINFLRKRAIESKRRSYSLANSEPIIPYLYISDEEASIDPKRSLTIALLLNYYLVKEGRNSLESKGVIL